MGRPMAALHVRTQGDPGALTASIREQIRKLDSDIAPISVIPYRTVISSSVLFLPRMAAILGGAFGLVALSLAVVGVYGVVAFMVGRRTQEIGVRIALGAQQWQILRMVLANGISLAVIGLMLGMGGAFAATPLMGGVLLELNQRDRVVFLAVAAALSRVDLGA